MTQLLNNRLSVVALQKKFALPVIVNVILVCPVVSVATPAVESGARESVNEIQAPAEAVQVEEEEEEEERVEPREGEGEWQQISVPVLPPVVLEVGT